MVSDVADAPHAVTTAKISKTAERWSVLIGHTFTERRSERGSSSHGHGHRTGTEVADRGSFGQTESSRGAKLVVGERDVLCGL
jgi:hypothetical protein